MGPWIGNKEWAEPRIQESRETTEGREDAAEGGQQSPNDAREANDAPPITAAQYAEYQRLVAEDKQRHQAREVLANLGDGGGAGRPALIGSKRPLEEVLSIEARATQKAQVNLRVKNIEQLERRKEALEMPMRARNAANHFRAQRTAALTAPFSDNASRQAHALETLCDKRARVILPPVSPVVVVDGEDDEDAGGEDMTAANHLRTYMEESWPAYKAASAVRRALLLLAFLLTVKHDKLVPSESDAQARLDEALRLALTEAYLNGVEAGTFLALLDEARTLHYAVDEPQPSQAPIGGTSRTPLRPQETVHGNGGVGGRSVNHDDAPNNANANAKRISRGPRVRRGGLFWLCPVCGGVGDQVSTHTEASCPALTTTKDHLGFPLTSFSEHAGRGPYSDLRNGIYFFTPTSGAQDQEIPVVIDSSRIRPEAHETYKNMVRDAIAPSQYPTFLSKFQPGNQAPASHGSRAQGRGGRKN